MSGDQEREHRIDIGYSLRLDDESFQAATERAEAEGKTIEDLLAERLARIIDKVLETIGDRLFN